MGKIKANEALVKALQAWDASFALILPIIKNSLHF
jgi:hypothetical protein